MVCFYKGTANGNIHVWVRYIRLRAYTGPIYCVQGHEQMKMSISARHTSISIANGSTHTASRREIITIYFETIAGDFVCISNVFATV